MIDIMSKVGNGNMLHIHLRKKNKEMILIDSTRFPYVLSIVICFGFGNFPFITRFIMHIRHSVFVMNRLLIMEHWIDVDFLSQILFSSSLLHVLYFFPSYSYSSTSLLYTLLFYLLCWISRAGPCTQIEIWTDMLVNLSMWGHS